MPEIRQKLGLSELASSELYLSAVFAHDRQIMNYRITYEEVANQIVIIRDHFDKTFCELEDMADDRLWLQWLE